MTLRPALSFQRRRARSFHGRRPWVFDQRAALLIVLSSILPAALPSAGGARAATAYVTDELVLNVFSEQNQTGQRLATLHSGAALETLAASGDFTQVRLPDGVTGWVKSTYLTSQVPATVKVKQLEEELDRSRSTTPALAEAAARSEVEQLKRELGAKQAALDAATAARIVPAAALSASHDPASHDSTSAESAGPGDPVSGSGMRPGAALGTAAVGTASRPLGNAALALGAAGAGFWAGYVTLARRVRRKFGGLKVY
jgi:hypothetical protein